MHVIMSTDNNGLVIIPDTKFEESLIERMFAGKAVDGTCAKLPGGARVTSLIIKPAENKNAIPVDDEEDPAKVKEPVTESKT